jgi:hypothetical protein
LFACTLFCAVGVFAQSKKDLEKSLNAEKALNDSLRKQLTLANYRIDSLTAGKLVSDSLTKAADPYKEFYNHMYAMYLKPMLGTDTLDLSVAKATAMVDSLVVARSARIAKGDTSLTKMQAAIDQQKALTDKAQIQLDLLRRVIGEATGADRTPVNSADFKGKWETYMTPLVVVGTSPQSAVLNTGAIGVPDSLYNVRLQNIPRSITFGENDLADITFMGGRTTNCFYKIVGYDPVKPFYIDLSRGDDLKMRVHAINTNRGMQVSVEIPTAAGEPARYLFGYMKR